LLPKKNRGETVNVSFSLHWGDEKSLFGQSAAAGFAGVMVTRGTSKFTRQQLADEFDRLKITGGVYSYETTRTNLAESIRLMAHVLRNPVFPESEFEQLRKQALTDIESGRNDPSILASEAMELHFNRYPKGDWRAAKTTDEQLAETQALTLAAVNAFYQKFYGASQGELAIVGDFDPAEISKVVSDVYDDWRSSVPYTRVPSANFDVPPLRKLIHTPDKENGTYLAQLNLNKRDDDSDYAALIVANYLFGGGAGLDSRLMQRVRQKEGLSYSIGSSLNIGSLDRAASFSIEAIAAPQNMAKVEATVRSELERVMKEGFSATEVARAKSGILQQRLQSRTRDSSLASGWRSLLYLNRTFSWSKALEDKINALTAEQVNAAFREAIDPAKLSVVMAFDQGKVK
jgi:zinc protease